MTNEILILCVTLFAVAAGCNRAESTVSGIVTLDGTPMDHGRVTFVPADKQNGLAATGNIDDSGHYTVEAAQSGGLPAAKYLVKVIAREDSIPNSEGGPPMPGKRITPEQYARTATSELEYEIEPGRNTIDIEMSSE